MSGPGGNFTLCVVVMLVTQHDAQFWSEFFPVAILYFLPLLIFLFTGWF